MDYGQVADLLKRNLKEIVERWERRAVAEIEALKGEDRLSVRDHLLFYLEDLIRAVEKLRERGARAATAEAYTVESSEQHGRMRATIEGYDIEQLIHEYALLRQVVSDFLQEREMIDLPLLEAISRINERALLTSAREFSQSLVKTREKIASALIHDIRNPLTAIKVSLDVIVRAKGDPERHGKLAERAIAQVGRIYKMTEEVLEAVRIDAGHALELDFQLVDIRKALGTSFDSISMTYPERVELDIPMEPIEGVFGVEGIGRLLENLVVNAVKYGDPERKATLRFRGEGADLVIEVHNWGEPIDEQKRDAIFLSFNRSGSAKKYRTQGWGIGLTFVRAVVDAHQGRIEVTSTREGGTCFRVRIPKSHPERTRLTE